MLTTIDTTYTDTRAADLAWELGREPQPSLATLDLELDGDHVQLRVLGASHQVLLRSGEATCSETVACLPGSRTPLPMGVSKRIGDLDYEFAARVETLSPGSFGGRAQELLALVADHPHGLAATFPGAPDAFTALLAHRHDGQVHWRTWHSYPQECRLVSTRTRVAVRRRDDGSCGGPTDRAAGRSTGDAEPVDRARTVVAHAGAAGRGASY
ncbi:DUF2617 family protein [Streptomyces bohaiensis]|uniref:DUF2617 family protein n=1 Tax=Streptomyces bohaiensis TaxID=1431344 RepID=A0ABX1CB10_9ACTN|nr:DUF2617 family protein [Streptomyces bohaiensis]NJQ16307.1 DUF2617 family protein [Streptomyces bohaiensis]